MHGYRITISKLETLTNSLPTIIFTQQTIRQKEYRSQYSKKSGFQAKAKAGFTVSGSIYRDEFESVESVPLEKVFIVFFALVLSRLAY